MPTEPPNDGGGIHERWWQSTFWVLYIGLKVWVSFVVTFLFFWTIGVRP